MVNVLYQQFMIVSNLINLLGSPGTLLARKLPIELPGQAGRCYWGERFKKAFQGM